MRWMLFIYLILIWRKHDANFDIFFVAPLCIWCTCEKLVLWFSFTHCFLKQLRLFPLKWINLARGYWKSVDLSSTKKEERICLQDYFLVCFHCDGHTTFINGLQHSLNHSTFLFNHWQPSGSFTKISLNWTTWASCCITHQYRETRTLRRCCADTVI